MMADEGGDQSDTTASKVDKRAVRKFIDATEIEGILVKLNELLAQAAPEHNEQNIEDLQAELVKYKAAYNKCYKVYYTTLPRLTDGAKTYMYEQLVNYHNAKQAFSGFLDQINPARFSPALPRPEQTFTFPPASSGASVTSAQSASVPNIVVPTCLTQPFSEIIITDPQNQRSTAQAIEPDNATSRVINVYGTRFL